MAGARTVTVTDETELARHVAWALRQIRDPIGLGAAGPADEYDHSLPGILTLVRDSLRFETAIVAYPVRIAVEAMGLDQARAKPIRATRALLALCEANRSESDILWTQAISSDGLFACRQ